MTEFAWQAIHYLFGHPAPSVPSVPPVIAQPTVSAGSVDGVIESIVNNAVKLPSAITVAVLMRTKCGLLFHIMWRSTPSFEHFVDNQF
jgi:hypothetical protein